MTTTTNPSLAVDNDAERRGRAWGNALTALSELDAIHDTHRLALEAENARLRAALTEAERDRDHAFAQVDVTTVAWSAERDALAESERARAILAKQLDEEVARTPRLRQEQTAEIERLKAEVASAQQGRAIFWERSELALAKIEEQTEEIERLKAEVAVADAGIERLKAAMFTDSERVGGHLARIAELEAEVQRLKADTYTEAAARNAAASGYRGPLLTYDGTSVPAPAAPAVPVVEVGSRWREIGTGELATVTEVDEESVGHRFDHGFCDRLYRRAFREQFTRLPDEPAGGGER